LSIYTSVQTAVRVKSHVSREVAQTGSIPELHLWNGEVGVGRNPGPALQLLRAGAASDPDWKAGGMTEQCPPKGWAEKVDFHFLNQQK
jgi:hypothetical protein